MKHVQFLSDSEGKQHTVSELPSASLRELWCSLLKRGEFVTKGSVAGVANTTVFEGAKIAATPAKISPLYGLKASKRSRV